MKSKRKWLAGILSVVMTMTFMPTYAFAGEATEGGNNKEATWTVVIDDGEGTIRENYETLQDAMDHGSEIELNRDASGKGCFEETYSMESKYYTIDFKGHTYTITEGVGEGQESGPTAINLKGSCYGTFRNGTLKIKNCSAGINALSVDLDNFNVDASGNSDCKKALSAYSTRIEGNSSVKVQSSNNAIEANRGAIKTTGVIQGSVVGKSEENLKIYTGLFTEKPKDQYIAKGYEVKANAEDLFEVVPTEEYAPLLKKIQSLREECDKAEKSLASDKKKAEESIEKIQKNLENAETNLNDGIHDKDIDKAISEAEASIQEAKEELNTLKAFITQKDKEYKEKGKKLQGDCDALDAEMKDIDESKYDFDDFDASNIRYSAEEMETVFASNKDEEGEECNWYLSDVEYLSENLDDLEIKVEKVKKLPDKVNKELSQELDAARKDLADTKQSLEAANKKQEELNKKIEEIQRSLEEAKKQLAKAEEQLKKQNSVPTPTAILVKKPGQVKGLKLKAGKKKVTVTYKKVSGATSYRVTYSTSKKFKKAKTVTVKSGKTVKKTISKLKSKKTYYVKVCAVKKVKGKNYTGKWSAVKKVKVK
ncbi:MAG: hypothetical protein ACI4J9_01110 [Mogibacterium kristiansenii]|uniref:hypothetical protein n=1 Tax=Mogibacterium kristiansenii TaxID=2606708 RepID=UPI003F00E1AE